MKPIVILSVLAVSLALIVGGCKNDSQTAPPGSGRVSGTVLDIATNNPLSGVTITPTPPPSSGQTSQTTGADGKFDFTFQTDSAKTISLRFQKSGFRDTTVATQIASASFTELTVTMRSSSVISGGTTTGTAATIRLVSANPTDISVYGVGGNETSYLEWEARDSVGLPIDAAHAVSITFSIAGGLNGGEFVYPATVTTNAQGRATTSFSSGVVSGAVQVVATAQAGGRTIQSQPVRIVIHSGFPDQRHFSISAGQLNFPALGIVGLTDNIGVLVGDIYSNPVATNTAVYFATRAGVIVSSAFTDASGRGAVNLISGNPVPLFANALTPYGNGYHYVIASTIGQGGSVVRDSILILWSGASQIDSIIPSSINVPNAGFQVINFKVSDPFGNTLSQGTTISLTVTGVQADLAFGNNGTFIIDRDINFPPGAATHYSCVVSDKQPDTSYVSSATLSISVTSPGNGNASATIGGIIR